MSAHTLPLNHMLYETTKHGTSDFPIQFYIDEIYRFRNECVPVHWHMEPEFFVAKGGDVLVRVGVDQIVLQQDSGIFISSNILHGFEQVKRTDKCQCPNIVFSADLIAPHSSCIYEKYIRPVLMNPGVPYFILHPHIPWHKEILNKLSLIFAILKEYGAKSIYGPFPSLPYDTSILSPTCYEMQVQNNLNLLWQTLFCYREYIPEISQDKKGVLSQVRLQHMISFIQQSYEDPITLQDIALSANISKSEASRCFQSYLNCSPVEYLLQYRMELAQKLLHTTMQSIHEICLKCGFNSPSYFTKVFKNKTGLSPRDYRNTK
jgi:AraC-like DNA-binding protein